MNTRGKGKENKYCKEGNHCKYNADFPKVHMKLVVGKVKNKSTGGI